MLRPTLEVERMGDRKDLDWGKTVCPMQALAQHLAEDPDAAPPTGAISRRGAGVSLPDGNRTCAYCAVVQVPPLPPLGRISRSAHGV